MTDWDVCKGFDTPSDQSSPRPPEEGILNRHRQTDRQTDRHGNSMTELTQWGRFRENKPAAQAAGADPPPMKVHQEAKSTPSIKLP